MTNYVGADKTASQLREIGEAIKAMHDTIRQVHLIDPLKEFRQTLQVMEMADPFKELKKTILQMHSTFKEARLVMEAVHQVPDPLQKLRESIKTIQASDPLRGIREKIQEIQSLARSSAVQEAIKTIGSSAAVYRQLLQSTLPANFSELLFQEAMTRYTQAETEAGGNVGEAVERLVGEVKQDVEGAPRTRMSLEFWLNLLVAISILVCSMKLSERSEDRLIREIHVMQQTILEKIADPGPEGLELTYYVVERKVLLRSRPNTRKSNAFTTLYPNQKVQLVDRRGKWICVEYFNHLTNMYENGWCMIKYLKRLENIRNTKVRS